MGNRRGERALFIAWAVYFGLWSGHFASVGVFPLFYFGLFAIIVSGIGVYYTYD